MARTVFHAWSPQRRHTQQRMTILNIPRGHTPPVGTNEVDNMLTSDPRRFASSRRVYGRIVKAPRGDQGGHQWGQEAKHSWEASHQRLPV
jgi:hypothetical protein